MACQKGILANPKSQRNRNCLLDQTIVLLESLLIAIKTPRSIRGIAASVTAVCTISMQNFKVDI